MPTFRKDLGALAPYVPGRPIEDLAGEMGIAPDQIVKLASNESPDGPFPGVIEAATSALASSHRYPDTDATALSNALSGLARGSGGSFVGWSRQRRIAGEYRPGGGWAGDERRPCLAFVCHVSHGLAVGDDRDRGGSLDF